MKNIKYIIAIASIIISTLSCEKSDTPDIPIPSSEVHNVYICNEGNFMYGNASLSLYNKEEKKVYNQIFYNTNNVPLGDVLQSMNIIDNRAFLVVNNSGKIQVIDSDSHKYVATITDLNSPRYIIDIDYNKAYVTDLYAPIIHIVDHKTYKKTGEIKVGRGTEAIVKHGDYAYVCSWSFSNMLYKIDTKKDIVVDSLVVTKQPNSLVIDKYNNLWVLSDGGYSGSPYGQERAALSKINLSTFKIEHLHSFESDSQSPTKLTSDGEGENLFFINGSWGESIQNGGVYKVSNLNSSKPTLSMLIPEDNRLFYGLGVDPDNSDIYISDAIDFQQKGVVFRYSSSGVLKDHFYVDIIPGYFHFKREAPGK